MTAPPIVKPSRGASQSGSAVTAQDLQNAVLLVLGLLASLALVNAPAEFAALGQHWRNLLEFLVSGVLLL